MLTLSRAASLAALLLTAACATAKRSPTDFEASTSQPGVALSSQPPGAEVWVDGAFSGFCTPCVLGLEKDEAHLVELRLPGYETVERRLESNSQWRAIPWSEGDVNATHWRFPLLLTLGGFFWPARLDRDSWPSRVHVRMRLSGAG